ncbi:MAG: YihY/virulence factor BrkB family protein [Bacteroidia bacterium]
MSNLHQNIMDRNIYYRRVIEWSKNTVLPGFAGISIYYFVRFFRIRLGNESLNMRASSIAFNFFLAIVPGLIFLFTLLPYVPIDNMSGELLIFLSEFLPESAYETIRDTLVDILKTQRVGLLSFVIILALYYSQNGFHSLLEAFDKNDPRPFWKKRLLALGFSFILPFLLILGIAILTGTEALVKYLLLEDYMMDYAFSFLLLVLKWMVFFAIILTGTTLLYYYGTPRMKRWKIFMPGAFFASVIIMLCSVGFGLYVDNFSQYNKLFGSLGALIVVMVLLYINAAVLVIGYEINDIILISRKYEKLAK